MVVVVMQEGGEHQRGNIGLMSNIILSDQMEMKKSSSLITEQQEEQKEDNVGHQQQQQLQQQQHFHVLAVDDSIIDRKLLERLLRDSSYQVTCVDSGHKALEYLGLLDTTASAAAASALSPQQQAMKVNLIMTDYCMPGISGYDLLQRVKGSSWKDVPVVVMSSENIPSRISMCLEGGAEEFLLKPVQLSDVEKLQSHLQKSHDSSNICKITDIDDDNLNIDNVTTCNKINNIKLNDNTAATNSNNNININNSIIKRKAMSPESSDRRPKLKGLAVV